MNFYNVCAVCGERIPEEHNEFSCPFCGSNVFKLIRERESEGRKILKKEDKVETVKILRKGVFEIDLETLFNGGPLIVSDKEGTYKILLNNIAKGKR